MVPPRPVARSVNPTLQEHLTNLAQRTVGPQWATALEPLIGMLPLVGVEEGFRQARSPDPLTANLGGLTAAAGLMPGLEGAGEKAVVKEGAKAAERAAESYTAEHLNAFRGLANAQRGEPELAMVRAQKELSQYPSGATLGTLMEHVGDLTHRMSQKYAEKMNWGREWVEPKVRNQLLNLQNVVDRDRMAQIPITPSMSRYAEEHAKLPVFNRAQQLSRDAAVALGRKDFDAAERHLTDLRQMLDSPGAYETEASKYDPNFEKSEPTLDQQVAKVVQRAKSKESDFIPHGDPRRERNLAAFMEGNHADVPRVTYHATTGDFSTFDPRKAGKNTGDPTSRLGHFVTSSPESADPFARVPDKKFLGTGQYLPGANIMPVHISLKNPYTMNWRDYSEQVMGLRTLPKKSANKAVDDFVAKLKDAGHDGIRIEGGWKPGMMFGSPEFASDNWVVFEPEQITSAVGNKGTYSRTSKNILDSALLPLVAGGAGAAAVSGQKEKRGAPQSR